eukprot:1107645-Pelagomonas_calceolata.AAC.2
MKVGQFRTRTAVLDCLPQGLLVLLVKRGRMRVSNKVEGVSLMVMHRHSNSARGGWEEHAPSVLLLLKADKLQISHVCAAAITDA